MKWSILIYLFFFLSTALWAEEGFLVVYTAPEKTISNKTFSMEYNSKTKNYIFRFGDLVLHRNFESDDWGEQLESLQNSIEISFNDAKNVRKEVFGRIRMNMLKEHNFNAPDIKILATTWMEVLKQVNGNTSPMGDCETNNLFKKDKNEIEFWKSPAFLELKLSSAQDKDIISTLVEKTLAKEGFAPADSLFDLNVGKMERKDDPLGNPHKSTEELLREWVDKKNNSESTVVDSAPLKFGIGKDIQLDKNTSVEFKQESMAIQGAAGQRYLIGDKSYHSFLRKVGDDYKEFLNVDRVEVEVLHEILSSRIFLRVNGAVNYLSNDSGLGKVLYDNWQKFETTIPGVATGHTQVPGRDEIDINLKGKMEQDIREPINSRLDLLARYEAGINLNNAWREGSYASARVELGVDVNAFTEGVFRGNIGGRVYLSRDQYLDNNHTDTVGMEITGRIYQKNNQALLIVFGANDNMEQSEQDKKVFGEVNSYFGMRSSVKF